MDPQKPVGPFPSHEAGGFAEVPEGSIYPRNPVGPTGIAGRGRLNTWGAQQAADAIITRHNPVTGKLEALLVKRGDADEQAQASEERAFPGGWLDEGEDARTAAARELREETALTGLNLDFVTAREVFRGYADDWRNTDNAWLETTAFHLHLTPEQAAQSEVAAGPAMGDAAPGEAPEIRDRGWVEITDDLLANMFASHGLLLAHAVRNIPRTVSIDETEPKVSALPDADRRLGVTGDRPSVPPGRRWR